MEGIGAQLHAARARWDLTLREVEERRNLLAQQWGNPSFKISASWLDRVERENRELSAAKLIVLAYVYGLTTDQMLALCQGPSQSPAQLEQISSPNSTQLLLQGPLELHARLWLPDTLVTDQPPEDTLLLPTDQTTLPSHYRRGVIGRRDRTMEPMIRVGSIVLIDIQKRAIAGRKDWNNEFDRPIYFLFTRTGYVCGFCEIDKKAEWLTLVPHNLSYETNKRWKYRKEIEVVGMVAGVFSRRVA
jgi:hypothetical protein